MKNAGALQQFAKLALIMQLESNVKERTWQVTKQLLENSSAFGMSFFVHFKNQDRGENKKLTSVFWMIKISLPITPALIIFHEILVPSEAESSNGLSLKLISLRG